MKTVLAHGVFDLLHLGHVRHLKQARKLGDRLIVSVTSDKFVNKGPGRPVFNENERRDMLQELKDVDGVVISDYHTAEAIIEHIRPDIFVKGPDYAKSGIDPREAAACERVGARVVFTEGETFSSSHFINHHLRTEDQANYLATLQPEKIFECFEKIENYQVLVAGEDITDKYSYVLPMGKPPKEAILSCALQYEESFPGGVRAIKRYLDPFVDEEVELFTPLKTLVKERFVDPTTMRKLFEVYDGTVRPPENGIFKERLKCVLPYYDMVIVADFGHGLIDDKYAKLLSDNARWLAVTCQANSENWGFNLITKYPRADYICMDIHEARLAAGNRRALGEELAYEMRKLLDCPNGVITLGKEGCVTWGPDAVHLVPSFADKVIDTLGAGDAFLAATAPLVKAGLPMNHVGFVGNVMGALKVAQAGQGEISKKDLITAITGLLK